MTGILSVAAGRNTNQLTASVAPSAVTGAWDSELGSGITDFATAYPSGGLAPYTYSWAKVSGYDFGISPTYTSQNVQFTFGGPSHQTAVFRVTVQDALHQTATADVNVTAN